MIIAAFFILANSWKPPKCSSPDDRISKIIYIHTIKYYLVKKECNSNTCFNMDEPQKHYAKPDTNTIYNITPFK